MTAILTRPIPQRARDMLVQQGLHPVLAQLYAARGVVDKSEVQSEFTGLIPPLGAPAQMRSRTSAIVRPPVPC